jgi:WD40 repeat protein
VETAAGGRWERPVVEPPIHQTSRAAEFGQSSLSFSPDGRLLAAADSGGIALLDTSELREVHRIADLPNNPPARFDPLTGDLWAYGKTDGLIRWTLRESDDELVLNRAGWDTDGGVGRLAVAADFVAVSKGTSVRVHQVSTLGEPSGWEDLQLYESPVDLALADGGEALAAFWMNPVRAGLWTRHDVEWRLSRMLTNAPVLNGLYAWNATNGFAVPLALQQTEAEKDEPLRVLHWPEGTLLTGAAGAPVVVSSVERDRGVHVDVLIGRHCRHFAVFHVENDRGRFAVTLAISPDGSRLAAIHRDGHLRLWDLRQLLARLSELRLEVPGFDLGEPAGRPPVKAVREDF